MSTNHNQRIIVCPVHGVSVKIKGDKGWCQHGHLLDADDAKDVKE